MRNRWIVMLLFLGLSVGLSAANPQIVFKSMQVNFGDVDDGKPVDILFDFENKGDSDLEIKAINPTCGCTISELKKRTYKPGEKGQIPARFNPSGYNGQVTKSISVETNDPANQRVLLSFTGSVKMKNYVQAELQPGEINLGKVRVGKKMVKVFNIVNSGSMELKVLEIVTVPEVIVDMPQKALPPKKTMAVKVHFTPMEAGKFTTLVKIRTNDTRFAYKIFRIDAEVN